MTRVKVCGITNLEDALAACDAGANALGFVVAEEGKRRGRHVSPENALAIIEKLPPFVTTVAVCVNSTLSELVHLLAFVDLVQMHGEESPDLLPMGHLGIKAFRAGPDFRAEEMKEYRTRAWLLDAYVPDAHGGTGTVCDWEVAQIAARLGTPLILAGGLTPENVGEAIQRVAPFAVDVSSGVEREPGKKDHDRIRTFIDNVRKASVA